MPRYTLVDLDRTMAYYTTENDQGRVIGKPIPLMVERVKRWLRAGKDVRIFTARASRYDPIERKEIELWCEKVFGHVLPLQNWKDFDCEAIWDDIAVSVEPNTGWRSSCDIAQDQLDPITDDEELKILEKQFDSSTD